MFTIIKRLFIMKKVIVLIFLILLTVCHLAIEAEPLKGIVKETWSVDFARKQAFDNVQYSIDTSNYPPDDPHYSLNQKAGKEGKMMVKDWLITFYSDGSYGVKPFQDKKALFFSPSGKLESISIDDQLNYPKKTYKYSYPEGKLIYSVISPSEGNNFLFLPDGKLDAHWIGDTCYDENGSVILTRKNLDNK
jgi:hypothetical protein